MIIIIILIIIIIYISYIYILYISYIYIISYYIIYIYIISYYIIYIYTYYPYSLRGSCTKVRWLSHPLSANCMEGTLPCTDLKQKISRDQIPRSWQLILLTTSFETKVGPLKNASSHPISPQTIAGVVDNYPSSEGWRSSPKSQTIWPRNNAALQSNRHALSRS